MEWFKIWFEDRKSIEETMYRNMVSDLKAGYDPNGKSITEQMQAIKEYREETYRQMMEMVSRSKAANERWCYFDLLFRGAITE